MDTRMRTRSGPPRQAEALRAIGTSISIAPFDVRDREIEVLIDEQAGRRADAVLTLGWQGQSERFVAEYKAPGTPQQVDLGLQQLRRMLARANRANPMIIAPYLSPATFDRLIDENVSAIDLSGNYAIVVPGRWLVVRTGAKNRYPSSDPIKNIYRGRSGLVARAVLIKRNYETAVAMLNERGGPESVSAPTISKVLKVLEQELIIDRRGRFEVTQPDVLLDSLAANFRAPELLRRQTGKIGVTREVLAQLDRQATQSEVRYAFDATEKYAALPSSQPIVRIFTDSIERLLSDISVDSTSRFPDVELIETDEPTVYFDRQRDDGLWWTSPLQVYLELTNGGKREKDAAQRLRGVVLSLRTQ